MSTLYVLQSLDSTDFDGIEVGRDATILLDIVEDVRVVYDNQRSAGQGQAYRDGEVVARIHIWDDDPVSIDGNRVCLEGSLTWPALNEGGCCEYGVWVIEL